METNNSPLFELPAEVRELIWNNLVVPSTRRIFVDSSYDDEHQLGSIMLIPLSLDNHYRISEKIDLSILRSCKLFHKEILPIILIHNEFVFQDTPDYHENRHTQVSLVEAFLQWVLLTGMKCALKLSYEYEWDGWKLEKLLGHHNFVSRITKAVHKGIRLASLRVIIIASREEFESMLGQRSGEESVEYITEGFGDDYEQSGNVYVDHLTLLKELAEVLRQMPDCHKQLDIVIGDKLTVVSEAEPLEMVKELHFAFGGDLHINEQLCYRNGKEVLRPFENGGILGKAWLDHGDIGWIWS